MGAFNLRLKYAMWQCVDEVGGDSGAVKAARIHTGPQCWLRTGRRDNHDADVTAAPSRISAEHCQWGTPSR